MVSLVSVQGGASMLDVDCLLHFSVVPVLFPGQDLGVGLSVLWPDSGLLPLLVYLGSCVA